MKRAEAAVSAFRAAQELRPDIRSYQGLFYTWKNISLHGMHLFPAMTFMYSAVNIYRNVLIVEIKKLTDFHMNLNMAGLVHTYLALSKIKEALYASREAMKAMPQSAKALKLVGDVHASNSSGREKASGQLFKSTICRVLSLYRQKFLMMMHSSHRQKNSTSLH